MSARAPSTRPLNRVLRRIANRRIVRNGYYWERLDQLVDGAPDDAHLPESTEQHDRMISLPSPLLYEPDTAYARRIAQGIEAVRGVLPWTEN